MGSFTTTRISESRARKEAVNRVLSLDNIDLACFLDKFYRDSLRYIRVVADGEENDEEEIRLQ